MIVVAIIQARTGSRRLPGKVLMDLRGKPALARVIERTQAAPGIDRVVVATSVLAGDDAVANLCKKLGVACIRGDEADVLARFAKAAEDMDAEGVVRITADCPLLDPDVVGQAVAAFRAGAGDYVSNALHRTFPDGLDVEVFSRAALDAATAEAIAGPEREHVTKFIQERPDRFRQAHITQDRRLASLRWTLDHPEDLIFIRAVYDRIPGDTFGQQDVLDLLAREPALAELNQHHTVT